MQCFFDFAFVFAVIFVFKNRLLVEKIVESEKTLANTDILGVFFCFSYRPFKIFWGPKMNKWDSDRTFCLIKIYIGHFIYLVKWIYMLKLEKDQLTYIQTLEKADNNLKII